MRDFHRQFEQQQRSMTRSFWSVAALGLVVNIAIFGAVGYGLYWGYQHVIAPSFGTPELRVK